MDNRWDDVASYTFFLESRNCPFQQYKSVGIIIWKKNKKKHGASDNIYRRSKIDISFGSAVQPTSQPVFCCLNCF